MSKITNSFFLIAIIIIALLSVKNSNAAEFENWTFLGGQTKIRNMNFSFHTANFFREGNDYFLNHTQLTLDFPSKHKLQGGIGYKQEYVEFPDRWRKEYRPMIHLYYHLGWGNWSFRDRNRWEFRFIERELINRYRNQLQLTYQKFASFSPYLSTEFSFYFDKLNYTRQRTIIGSQIQIKSVYVDLFAGHQVNEDFPGIWVNKFIMGTGLSYKF